MFDIGNRVSELRKQLGHTQGQFAEILNITRENLSRIENNKVTPSIQLIQKICEVAEISLGDFFGAGDLPPDLYEWIKLGEKLTSEQRLALIQAVDRLIRDNSTEKENNYE